MTADTFGLALGVPVHGVCTLDGLAFEAQVDGPFVVATDARRKEVYWARYENPRTRTTDAAVDRPADIAEQVARAARRGRRSRAVPGHVPGRARARARVRRGPRRPRRGSGSRPARNCSNRGPSACAAPTRRSPKNYKVVTPSDLSAELREMRWWDIDPGARPGEGPLPGRRLVARHVLV